MWDPALYRRFSDERSRPFYDLVGRIDAAEPRRVADLGCGPGELTADLCRRWPSAQVVGVDNSPEMITAAQQVLAGLEDEGETLALRFELGDASDWLPEEPVDVIVSNALLQWIPDHESLMVRWIRALSPSGWLAVQMPGNFDAPAHALLRQLAGTERWRPLLGEVRLNRQAGDPADYLDLLAGQGCAVDAWETTYLHVLEGDDPVLRWISGTGLRPVIAALDDAQRAEFTAEYGALLRKEYPKAGYGTVFPFRRVFLVAQTSAT
jgi:trans-aconitate 2-methyltransferase